MNHRSYLALQVPHTLAVTINRHGHTEPFPKGHVVQCIYRDVVNRLYSTLSPVHTRLIPDAAIVRMCDAGPGLVVDTGWAIDKYDLQHAHLVPMGWDDRLDMPKPPHLKNAHEDQWYLVAFRQGLFWARYDWLEPVTTASGAEA